MRLIKLSEDQYVLTDDSDISIGNIVAEKLLTGKYELFTIHTLNDIDKSTQKKIAYSTQPESLGTGWMQSVLPLLLSEVKEVLGVVDVEKKAWKYNPVKKLDAEFIRAAYICGYNECLEDNKEKKYTEEDMEKAYFTGVADFHEKCILRKEAGIVDILIELFSKYIQSIQPKTEWEVEMVDGKLKLKQPGE